MLLIFKVAIIEYELFQASNWHLTYITTLVFLKMNPMDHYHYHIFS